MREIKKFNVALFIFILICGMQPSSAQMTQASINNETRLVKVAEHEVMKELVLALSPSVRGNGGAMEIAIGLIGVSRSDIATDALVNLLGLRLDGAGSEELSCQILTRGKTILRRLERLNPADAVSHCQTGFIDLRRRELAQILDVKVDQVCRSEVEVRSVRDELMGAIRSKSPCE